LNRGKPKISLQFKIIFDKFLLKNLMLKNYFMKNKCCILKRIFNKSLAVFLFLSIVFIGGSCSDNFDKILNSKVDTTNAPFILKVDTTVVTRNLSGKNEVWSYNEYIDKMDGEKIFFARVNSTNEVQLEAPYDGGSTFTLGIRKRKSESCDVFLVVSKGQFIISSIGDIKARIKFDNEAPFNITISETSDFKSNKIYLGSVQKIIQKLLKAKKVIIEAEFYQNGNVQAEFDVNNLKWAYK